MAAMLKASPTVNAEGVLNAVSNLMDPRSRMTEKQNVKPSEWNLLLECIGCDPAAVRAEKKVIPKRDLAVKWMKGATYGPRRRQAAVDSAKQYLDQTERELDEARRKVAELEAGKRGCIARYAEALTAQRDHGDL